MRCYEQGVSSACCGMIFNTKGFSEAADSQVSKLQESLVKASRGGVIPIVCDTSPCLGQLKASLSEPALKCAPSQAVFAPLKSVCACKKREAHTI